MPIWALNQGGMVAWQTDSMTPMWQTYMMVLYNMMHGTLGNNTVDYYVFQQMQTNNFTD